VAVLMSAATLPVAGSVPWWLGPLGSGLLAMKRAPLAATDQPIG